VSRGFLDSAGRWFLDNCDYRVGGLVIFCAVGLFVFWRRYRYQSWPRVEDCISLAVSLVGVFGAVGVLVVFLLTKPPAVESLSTTSLILIGLFVPIVVFFYAVPRLWVLLFPPEAPPKPPQS
jgi:heme A synthase